MHVLRVAPTCSPAPPLAYAGWPALLICLTRPLSQVGWFSIVVLCFVFRKQVGLNTQRRNRVWYS